MKGREFFKESYAKSITPWSGMKRVEELKRVFERWFEFMRIEKSRGGEYTFHHLLLRRV